MLLIWLTSEGQKVESNLEPLSGFEHGIPDFETQRFNHQAIAQLGYYEISKTIQGMLVNLDILAHFIDWALFSKVAPAPLSS